MGLGDFNAMYISDDRVDYYERIKFKQKWIIKLVDIKWKIYFVEKMCKNKYKTITM